jgi:hypothetical protein
MARSGGLLETAASGSGSGRGRSQDLT